MSCLSQFLLLKQLRGQPQAGLRQRPSRESATLTRPMSGRRASLGRELRWLVLTRASARRTTRSSLTIAFGTDRTLITIITGLTLFTMGLATRAGTIHRSL